MFQNYNHLLAGLYSSNFMPSGPENHPSSITNSKKIKKDTRSLTKVNEKKSIQKQICPRCGGKGRVAVRRNKRLVRYPICLKCRGSGFVPNRNEKCPACKGEKKIRTRDNGLVDCTKCLGSGLKHPRIFWVNWTQGSSPK